LVVGRSSLVKIKENVMNNEESQVVMITGAAGNLGQAVARAFQRQGARLALVDRSGELLENALPDLAETDDALFIAADLTDAGSVEAMVFETVSQFGRIDALFNIAGGFRAGRPLHETDLSDWEFLMNLNARTVFLTCRAVVPHMIEQGYGRIVNIGARAALTGSANMGPYIASKSAVIRLTEALAAELKDKGINVNCILPSTIDTPQNREAMPKADFSQWTTPEAIADVFLFLASPAAQAIRGAAISV
jgi:NAD(P)-dependent dehydrogenase (short-subunit alcohol dehydrogenase family)